MSFLVLEGLPLRIGAGLFALDFRKPFDRVVGAPLLPLLGRIPAKSPALEPFLGQTDRDVC
jgi:hypothetical protein